MLTFFYILRFFHIMSAAVWFGAVLLTPGDVRQTLERGRPHVDGLKDRLQKSVGISLRAGVLTVITGFAIVMTSGGFGNVPFRIHLAMGLAVLMLGLGFMMINPLSEAICDVIDQKGEDLEEAKSLATTFGALSGVNHLLWFITLGLMVIKSI
jgi:hypothetical protein